jgi:DNA helicase-2/ATP-dependent DNA helicase PcrA
MGYEPSAAQQAVIAADAPVAVVIGGAGTGKTTTAAAAAGQRLANRDQLRTEARAQTPPGRRPALPSRKRVLFVSFSRTAVRQILDRAAGVLGTSQGLVDVVTFHGLAWRILNDFGRFYGYPHPQRVQSSAETRLSVAFPGITYNDLIPAATALLQIPAVADYYERRYGTVICDEFQDTSDTEWVFVQTIAPTAQRILLGDPNQCIYAGMKGIDPHARVAEAAALPGAALFTLPPLSYREPTGVLPAAALASMERRFDDSSIAHAVETKRIVLHQVPAGDLEAEVAAIVGGERAAQKSVSIFTHTNAATAELSSALTASGIAHEQVGFTEAFGDALQAQFATLRWALTGEHGARIALAVYALSIGRGNLEKQFAEAIARKSVPAFEAKLKAAALQLRASGGPPPDYDALLAQLARLHQDLGFPRGEETWMFANHRLRRAVRVLEMGGTLTGLAEEIHELRGMTLVGSHAPRSQPVQLMNLHQTKGREADATVLLLQPDEFHGYELEPYPTGSRLLYVCLTRARERAHVVLPADVGTLHGLWAPFIHACVAAELL